MMRKPLATLLIVCALVCLSLPNTGWCADKPFVFGLLLVGPYNDHGYSQAHYDGGLYVEKTVPGTKMIYAGLKDEKRIQDLIAYLKQFDAAGMKSAGVARPERVAAR